MSASEVNDIMKSVLAISLIGLVLSLFPVSASGSESDKASPTGWVVSEDLTVSELTPGVWIHTSWRELRSGTRFPANGLMVRNGDELLLIDTAWGVDLTEELLDWIEAEIGLPVAGALVTHFHADSMGGSPALKARNIPVHGHAMTIELGGDEGVPLPESVGELKPGEAVTIGNVELFYPGPGHSRDNLVVWVPHAGVIFGSCAVRAPEFPGTGNTADADMKAWPESIRRVLDRYPLADHVVPGHGSPGDTSLLVHTIGLFDEP
jgi:glyoxylase-like metal-dependent hydrolase (beta-lactamase superfamily II)